MTGMRPSSIHVNGNGIECFPDGPRLVSRMLADAGYDCGLVGKLHLAGSASRQERRTDDGYRFFRYSPNPYWQIREQNDYADWLESKGLDVMEIVRRFGFSADAPGDIANAYGWLSEPSLKEDNLPTKFQQTTWCSEQAIEFIAQERPPEQPWLLSVNPFHPHHPFDPPWEYYQRYDLGSMPKPHFKHSDLEQQARLSEIVFNTPAVEPDLMVSQRTTAAYYAMIEQIDHEFGRIIGVLESTGQLENTIVIFMSDHGESLWDHGLLLKGCRFYEGLTRVPLIWSWPGVISSGVESDALVELTDIAPTLLEFAGVSDRPDMQGRSLAPIVTGKAPTDYHRDFVRSEFYSALNRPMSSFATMHRTQRWKLSTYHGTGLGELYDMEQDPWEHHNLWDDKRVQDTKIELALHSYDDMVLGQDWGPARTMAW